MRNQLRTEQTRAAIIRGALALLAREGASRLTFDAVAKECNISKGALTHHFRSKPDLIKGILQFRHDAFSEFRNAAVPSDAAAATRPTLGVEIAAIHRMMERSQGPARAILAIVVDDPSPMAFLRERFSQQIDRIRGEADDPDLAVLRWEMAWGLALHTLFGFSPLSSTELMRLFEYVRDDSRWFEYEK